MFLEVRWILNLAHYVFEKELDRAFEGD